MKVPYRHQKNSNCNDLARNYGFPNRNFRLLQGKVFAGAPRTPAAPAGIE
jgi:hypothetical protein